MLPRRNTKKYLQDQLHATTVAFLHSEHEVADLKEELEDRALADEVANQVPVADCTRPEGRELIAKLYGDH